MHFWRPGLSDEIERIRRTYQERDASGVTSFFSYSNPAYAFHMQEREWAILKAFRDIGLDLSNCRILEVGCGTGHILQRFRDFGAGDVQGIELMENRVASANKAYPNIKVQQGNAAQLPFTENDFDMTMQFMCISSVLDEKTRAAIAMEMWRVLRPGGYMLSYDLRPGFSLLAFIRAQLGRLRRMFVTPPPRTGHVTPIKPLGLDEIRHWNLDGDMKVYELSLDFRIAKIARYSRIAAQFCALAPWWRTSYLVLIKKPSQLGA